MSYKTDRLDAQVVKLLKAGAVGFMPSDTIYGLSCRALDEQAVERIYRLKKRDSDKPLIILIANISQLKKLNIDTKQLSSVFPYWPGAISFECNVTEAPLWLNRGGKFEAVRMPNNKALNSIIEEVGPIVSTSANLQGQASAVSVDEAINYFGDQLDFYVDVGDLSQNKPSTLVRSVNGKLEVIRPGAVKIEE